MGPGTASGLRARRARLQKGHRLLVRRVYVYRAREALRPRRWGRYPHGVVGPARRIFPPMKANPPHVIRTARLELVLFTRAHLAALTGRGRPGLFAFDVPE